MRPYKVVSIFGSLPSVFHWIFFTVQSIICLVNDGDHWCWPVFLPPNFILSLLHPSESISIWKVLSVDIHCSLLFTLKDIIWSALGFGRILPSPLLPYKDSLSSKAGLTWKYCCICLWQILTHSVLTPINTSTWRSVYCVGILSDLF